MEERNDKTANFGVTIFLILLTGILLFFSVKQKIDLEKSKEELANQISQEVSNNIKKEISDSGSGQDKSQFPDYDSIKGSGPDSMKRLNISSDCSLEKGCVNDKPATIVFDGLIKKYRVMGQFSRAYLYIDALVDYNHPLTSWDDIYFSINDKGGHLISDSNVIPVPPSDSSRFLYNLSSISYFPGIHDKEQNINRTNNVNFFNLLQDGSNLNIHVSVSSNRPGRVIKEASIYYECFEGSDCSIYENQ